MTQGWLVVTAAEPISDPRLSALAQAASAAGLRLGAFARLGEGGARAEADLDAAAALAALRAAPAAAGLDLNLLTAAQSQPKRLLLADMDSTIITVECIDEIADVFGVGPAVAAITEQAMRGELDFDGALRARVALLKGAPVGMLRTVWEERVRLSPGAEQAVRGMLAAGARTALVSGGFTFFTERVAAACGFQFHQANRLLEEDGLLTGAPADPILGREAKAAALARHLSEIGAAPEEALAVGDGANDLAMIRAAGLGVAYRAKPVVAAEADARLDHSDLTALLHLQGLST